MEGLRIQKSTERKVGATEPPLTPDPELTLLLPWQEGTDGFPQALDWVECVNRGGRRKRAEEGL